MSVDAATGGGHAVDVPPPASNTSTSRATIGGAAGAGALGLLFASVSANPDAWVRVIGAFSAPGPYYAIWAIVLIVAAPTIGVLAVRADRNAKERVEAAKAQTAATEKMADAIIENNRLLVDNNRLLVESHRKLEAIGDRLGIDLRAPNAITVEDLARTVAELKAELQRRNDAAVSSSRAPVIELDDRAPTRTLRPTG